MDDDKGQGQQRRKLQQKRAVETGGQKERRHREAIARSQIQAGEEALEPQRTGRERTVTSSKSRVARPASARGDRALAKGRPVTRGRPTVRGGMQGERSTPSSR